MSTRKSKAKNVKPPVEAKGPKPLTASQLFTSYMKAVGRANRLAEKLGVEITEAERLSTELSERFGVHVGNKPPAHKTRPVTREEPIRNEGDVDAEDSAYQPPPQGPHAEAPRLAGKESQEVAEIRRNAGLSPEEQEDADALEASSGPGRMAELSKAMGGMPTQGPVIPSPGAVEGVPEGEPDPGPDNRGGGVVEQKPLPEKE